MRHIREGNLYAYIDDALTPEKRSAIEQHLAQCRRCTGKLHILGQRHNKIQSSLSHIDAIDIPVRMFPAARHRFADYAHNKKEQAMRKGLFSKRFRPAWYAVVVLLVLSLSLTIAPVRTLASQFLALFRVQKIQFVELNPYTLPAGFSFEGAALEIDQLLKDNLIVEEGGEVQVVNATQADALMNFKPRYAALMGDDVEISALPAITMTMDVDLDQVQMLFDTLGYGSYTLPDDLDGAEISVQVQPSLRIASPTCANEKAKDCIVLMEMPSPSVSAPPAFDTDALGQLYLQMLGMNQEEAAAFSQSLDWTTTLVVPVPNTEADYKTVYIDGEAGTLITSSVPNKETEYILVWLKDDVIHAVIGKGDSSTAIQIARSLSD